MGFGAEQRCPLGEAASSLRENVHSMRAHLARKHTMSGERAAGVMIRYPRAAPRRDDWGGGGRGPFEVNYFYAPSIGIMLNAEKFAGDRSPPPPPPSAAAHAGTWQDEGAPGGSKAYNYIAKGARLLL